jgi:tetratricopeptide (TPR) repeat protein
VISPQPARLWPWLLGAAGLAVALAPSLPLLDVKLLAAGLALSLGLVLAGVSALGAGQAYLTVPDAGLMLGLVVFWACGSLAGHFSILPHAGDQLMARILMLGFWGLLASAAAPGQAGTRRVLKFILLAAALNAAYALLQRLGFDPVAGFRQAGSHARAMAFFGNPDFLAAFLVLAWPLALVVDWGLQPVLVLLGLLALALLATASRAGMLAAYLQAWLLLLWGWPRLPRGWRWGLAAAWLLLPLGLLLAPDLLLRPTLRLALWRETLRQAWQHPWLGRGPGSFVIAFNPACADHALRQALSQGNQFAEHPHNFILGLFYEGGLLWLAGFGLLLGLAFHRLPAGRGVDQAGRQRLALGLGILGLLIQNLFDRNLLLTGSAFYFWLLLGLMAPGAGLPAWPVQRTRRWILGLLLLVMALSPLSWLLRPTRDLFHLGQGEKVLGQAGQAKAAEAGLRAAALAARDAPAALLLADNLAAQQRFPEAAEEYAQALALDPASRPAALNLGNCRFKQGRLEDAAAAYRRALAIDPKSADAHFDLGYVLYYQRSIDQAVAEFNAALALDPNYAPARKMKEMLQQ